MGIEYNPYYLVNGMEVNGGLLLQMWLEKQPEVDRVLSSPHLRPLPELVTAAAGEENHPPDGTLWNLEMIRVPLVHEKLNITGSGIVIGQTDSGIEGNHPELKTSYRGAGGSDDYNWVDPWFGAKTPVDYAGHGTATLGIEVGSTRGIAPDAQWIGCVNLARNLGNPAYYLNCMQFMFAPYPRRGDPFLDGDTTLGANIVNNSWGCPRVEGCDAEVFEPAMRVLKTAGIFMSAAAGNAGYYGCSTITDPPAIYEDVFTAGAVDKTGTISSFSSLGPVIMNGNSRIKPDLLAPGEQILLAAPGGKYTFASGTSFAAPHISGVVALMWSANPKLIGDIETTTRLLIDNTQPYNGVEAQCGDARNGSGAGILDAFAAVQAAIDLKLGQ
jgi:subtilisin family serine protease